MSHGGIARGVVLAAVALTGAARSAWAGFALVSQQVELNDRLHEADFSLLFNQPPDFQTRDALGRPVNSFQYEIVPDTTSPIENLPVSSIRAVIRGDEINGTGRIPIRDGIEASRDAAPQAGGWGAVRGSVPFQLQGTRLTFAAPLQMLDDHGDPFSYRLLTTQSGQTTSIVTGVAVPLPAACWLAMTALPLLVRPRLRRRVRN